MACCKHARDIFAFLPNFVQRVEKWFGRGSIATYVLRVRCERFDGGQSLAGAECCFRDLFSSSKQCEWFEQREKGEQ
jgi:hypothetical protein